MSFEVGGQPDAVLQTKHSLNAAANLTDLSPEVWKTLRIWLVGLASGEIPPETTRFLIATADAPAGSACAALCIEEAGRDVAEVQIPFFMIKQSNDMISLIDGHDQRL